MCDVIFVIPRKHFLYLLEILFFFQACPLTALKFAELSSKAGIPPGVINVLPGTGSVCGQAIADHPKVCFLFQHPVLNFIKRQTRNISKTGNIF